MLPYWLLFLLWAGASVQSERQRAVTARPLFFAIASAATALFIGLRFQVGGDWGAYLRTYQNIFFLDFVPALGITDPGYAALNWVAAQGDWGIRFVNLVCAALFMAGFARLAWKQPNPALAMLIAVPYLIIVVAMGYTRQAAAIGLICLAIADASERRLGRLVLLIGIAALFHKTAILILPVALIPVLRRNALFGIAGAVVFVALFALLLRDSSDRLIASYVSGDYDSQGAAIRVGMNVLAAAVFLYMRKRIEMPAFQKSFWTACALLSVMSVFALATSSASSGIDRLSLYLIPLQALTFCRLPYLLGEGRRALPSVMLGVVGYCFMVQFVWMNYASHSGYWLPYRIGS